jgi:threonine/homoserine/homoserine lactone efflux protein
LGIAYLAWLAVRLWQAPVAAGEAAMPTGSGWRMFAAGLAITLGNPKIMLFYLALLPALVDLAGIDGLAWTALELTMLLVLVTVDLAWVVMAVQARRLIQSTRAMRACNRFSATVMALAAAAIAAR